MLFLAYLSLPAATLVLAWVFLPKETILEKQVEVLPPSESESGDYEQQLLARKVAQSPEGIRTTSVLVSLFLCLLLLFCMVFSPEIASECLTTMLVCSVRNGAR